METISNLPEAFARRGLSRLQEAGYWNKDFYREIIIENLEAGIQELEAAIGAATTELERLE